MSLRRRLACALHDMSQLRSSWQSFCISHGLAYPMQKCKKGFSVVGIPSQSKVDVVNDLGCLYSRSYLRCFHCILNMLVSKEFYSTYVCPPTNEVPPEIQENAKFFPYFSACCGALDGSLLHVFVSKFDMARFCSRKGFISTNLWQPVFSVCGSAIF